MILNTIERKDRKTAKGYPAFIYTTNGEYLQLIHYIDTDDSSDTQIEVVGDGDNGCYEWGIRVKGKILRNSNAGYGSTLVALQDALNEFRDGSGL